MGNIESRLDDCGGLYFKDQSKFTIASVSIRNSKRQLFHLTPNSYPATRYNVKRDPGDDTPVEFVQDPETPSSASAPAFLLRLNNDDELNFKFTFILRQSRTSNTPVNSTATALPELTDTILTGLTFAYASNPKELDNLITREFHANPNLQNNSNVKLVGDYSTEGNPSVQFDWSWTWRPPKAAEDKGSGWRNSCSFLDYDQRTNRLNSLVRFSFWVHNTLRLAANSQIPMASLEADGSARSRVPSSRSAMSHSSEGEAATNIRISSCTPPDTGDTIFATSTASAGPISAPLVAKVEFPHSRPSENVSLVEDGPLFRATMKALEQKTGSMRAKIKKVLKKAEAAQQSQTLCNESVEAFLTALDEASTSNAIQPALDHYFEKIARQILNYEQLNAVQLQKFVIDPLTRLYNNEIKQADPKKKEFEEESREYYAYVSRYLGQRQDSLKEKKRVERDSKYQAKRRNFELRRFDYSSFMQDLHGGRKEQEVLSHLTKYADMQAKNFLATAKKIEEMVPQLDALAHEVDQADKEFQFLRTEREEKRRTLEKNSHAYVEPDSSASGPPPTASGNAGGCCSPEGELGWIDSTGSQLHGVLSNSSSISSQGNTSFSTPAAPKGTLAVTPAGISSYPHAMLGNAAVNSGFVTEQRRKEGLLWALSRPGSHADPKGINKQAWHKFWIVLDQGKLSEYSNWKQNLDLHIGPIDLRMASVREARNTERRFCFEVITPQFKRVYQATSEEDMANWIMAINNALQSAVEGRGMSSVPPASRIDPPPGRDIGAVFTGKSPSYSGNYAHTSGSNNNDNNNVNRRTTVGGRPSYICNDSKSFEGNPSRLLLQVVREADKMNNWCADCGSASKVEWVSINLGIILCIECSGIHRSLGTHVSKIRSLTLDIHSFSNDTVEILLQVGNRNSNLIWEATLDQSRKPNANATREQRLKFITAKYSEGAYVEQLPSARFRFATPDEALVTSIKKNDIQGVLYGIALHANVNATDRSRHTHSVFLALAAADPVGLGSTLSGIPPRPSTAASVKAIPFPIAELLIQNGAEIPVQPPLIPLSAAARLYLSQRSAKVLGLGSLSPVITADKDPADTLGLSPNTRGTINDSTVSYPSPSDHREREKLHKRGSAGARFAGKVASLGMDR